LGDWKDRRIVILGLARQGKALSRYLAGQGAFVVVSDRKPSEELVAAREELGSYPIEFVLGEHPMSLLEGADMLFLSGGIPEDIPLVQKATERGIPISNDSQLFMELCPAPVIGVTGSAGKSTTTALVGRIAELDMGKGPGRIWVGGNIGRSLLADIDAIERQDWVVMELSSFQLEWMDRSPHIAAILNLSPNHLDRHKTMEAYAAAKVRILDFQSAEDVSVLGRDDSGAWELRDRVQGRLLAFGFHEESILEGTFLKGENIYLRMDGKELLLSAIDAIHLKGRHNVANVLAACALAAGAGFSRDAIEAGIMSFKGLPHRLEFVREVGGVKWFNDSIATSPDRAIASMMSFDTPLVLLAGGRDKDLLWERFAQVVCERVDHLILFGEAAQKIAKVMEQTRKENKPYSIDICTGLEQAVEVASRLAQEGDIVLLAPGGTSFDQFVDFVDRGERFRALVERI
jgi:UDP-N-acetylmuramoylalanine--D-glutamate ligase